MKLYLNSNIIKGTPEELVTYQELLKERGLDSEKSLFSFGHMHQPTEEEVQDTFKGFFGSLMLDKSSIGTTESSTDEAQTPSRELKVGDRVKVLNSLGGVVGEATVTAVLEGGRVELAGNNKEGTYLSDWSNYISNVEKIEKPASFGAIQAKAYLEDKSIDQVIDESISNYTVDSEPTAVQYYKVEDDSYLHPTVKQGTVVKKTGEDKTTVVFETSTGLKQTIPRKHLKLLDTNTTKDRFEFAEEAGVMLTTDTDFAVECEGHEFQVTKDEYLSRFEEDDVLTIVEDDGSNAISFKSSDGTVQFVLIEDVREVARPSK